MTTRSRHDSYQAWLLGEILLIGALAASIAASGADSNLRDTWNLPELRLFVDTCVMVVAGVVAVLASLRLSVDGRRLDLLLAAGFFTTCVSTLAFEIAPRLGGEQVGPTQLWAGALGKLLAAALVACAPLARGRIPRSRRVVVESTVVGVVAVALLVVWLLLRLGAGSLPEFVRAAGHPLPAAAVVVLGLQTFLWLATLVGFGVRYRAYGQDFDRWLALAATVAVFAEMHVLIAPEISASLVSQADVLRLVGYAILLVGVWNAIRSSEFGRAVAEERARVAAEIHDGLAQYLFAISTSISMLERGADLDVTLPRLKEAATLAQQEARFAVLALASAGGSASFDSALRRYVEFLTADGELDVELEIDPDLPLAPDEQIEVFRIVQEGLGNVRRHAGATRAEVVIGRRGRDRVVLVSDDGDGLPDEPSDGGGQGLRNMRRRAESIQAAFALRSRPGGGTALEVVLRP